MRTEPRLLCTRIARPVSPCAAVAPRATMRCGLTASISSNNRYRHILISLAFGRLCNRLFPPWLELETLDRVRRVDALAVHASLNKAPYPIEVLPVRRKVGLRGLIGPRAVLEQTSCLLSFAQNGLRGVFPKWARLAGRSSAAQRVEFAARFATGADAHGQTKYSTRIHARMASATLPMSA
jgi:hypothetical protein